MRFDANGVYYYPPYNPQGFTLTDRTVFIQDNSKQTKEQNNETKY